MVSCYNNFLLINVKQILKIFSYTFLNILLTAERMIVQIMEGEVFPLQSQHDGSQLGRYSQAISVVLRGMSVLC